MPIVEDSNQCSSGDTPAAKNKYIKEEIDKIIPSLPFNPLLYYDQPLGKARKTSQSAPASTINRQKVNSNKERNRLLTFMRRMNKVQRTVGWMGIIFSESFSPIIRRDLSEPAFDRLLESFINIRPYILEVIKQAWPEYPRVLEVIGGIFFHKRF